MKKVKIVLGLVILFLLSGCPDPTFVDTSNFLEADIKITAVARTYNFVYIYYTIENTGPRDIGYYEVYFKVDTTEGQALVYTNGEQVLVDEQVLGWVNYYVGEATVGKVVISTKHYRELK